MTPAGRPRKTDCDAALDAAIELLWQDGFSSTSMDDLLDRMGMSRSSFYSTFGSKHELLLRALDRYADRALGGLRELAAGHGRRIERLRAVIFRIARLDEPRGCLMVNCMSERIARRPDVRLILLRFDRDVEAVLRSLVDDEKHALLLKSAAYGATLLTKIGTPHGTVRDLLANAADRIGGPPDRINGTTVPL